MQTPPTPEPPRQKLMDYARDVGALRRWTRHTFTGENVMSALKTLAWVAPLTILIWVYAEREQLARTEDPLPIPINITSGNPNRHIVLLRPQEKVILANMSGPRSQLDATRNLFVRSEGTGALDISIDRWQLSRGTHELRTVDLVRNHPVFLDRGIVVTNCQPATLQVLVDDYDTRDLTVEPPPSVTNLVGTPVFEPARVRVRAPRDELERAGEIRVFADLRSFSEMATPGPHELTAVRVSSPELSGRNVSFSPGTVKATVEVRRADEELVLPVVAITPVIPAALQKKYYVECDDTLNNVTLRGPPDQIALLRSENPQHRPYAALYVSSEDLPAGTARTRRLEYLGLPPGVRASAEDLKRTVDFKLVERRVDQ